MSYYEDRFVQMIMAGEEEVIQKNIASAKFCRGIVSIPLSREALSVAMIRTVHLTQFRF
jgi:hypothetical protein